MGQDVKYRGKTYNGVEGVALPLIGGGEHIFPDVSGVTAIAADVTSGKTFAKSDGTIGTGSHVYSPYGDMMELVASYAKQTFALKDTDFNTWTPSTTAKAILATSNLGTAALDLENYEYMIKFLVESLITYISGTTKKAAPVRQIIELFQFVYRKPSNFTNLESETDNSNYATNVYNAPLMDYYNSSGTHTLTYTGSYGIYATNQAATFSSSTSKTPTLTVKRPVLNARCSTTYFSTTMAGKVDKDNSTVSCAGYLYRCKKPSFGRSVWDDIISTYNA